jgi:hypothetical protein
VVPLPLLQDREGLLEVALAALVVTGVARPVGVMEEPLVEVRAKEHLVRSSDSHPNRSRTPHHTPYHHPDSPRLTLVQNIVVDVASHCPMAELLKVVIRIFMSSVSVAQDAVPTWPQVPLLQP